MRNDKLIQIRVCSDEKDQWIQQAELAGLSLSAWIREQCNGEVMPDAGVRGRRPTEVETGEHRAVAKTSAKQPKTCVHGTEKRYRCWKCQGLAKIES